MASVRGRRVHSMVPCVVRSRWRAAVPAGVPAGVHAGVPAGVPAAAALAAAALATAVLAAGCTTTPAHPAPVRSPAAPLTALPTRPAPSVPPPDGSSDPVSDPVYPDRGNPLVDVRRYDLTLAWAPA